MATIQIKRRTTEGTGPLTGVGSIKAGEPLVDLNGGNLYIAKSTKTGTSSAPISATDYLEFLSKTNASTLVDSKINAQNLGTAATKNVGTTSGTIPVLDSSGKLSSSILPQIAITETFVCSSQAQMLALSNAQAGDICVRTDVNKTYILKQGTANTLVNWQELLTPTDKVSSVNGKTGVVSISLNELGGVSNASFTAHTGNNNIHLSVEQKNKLDDFTQTYIMYDDLNSAVGKAIDLTTFSNSTIDDGLILYKSLDTEYDLHVDRYYLGIDSSKVLTPTSLIDGGTF